MKIFQNQQKNIRDWDIIKGEEKAVAKITYRKNEYPFRVGTLIWKNSEVGHIGEEVDKAYVEEVKSLTIRKELVAEKAKDLKVIYTPIHGSGNMPVRRVLSELGYENVEIVKEQEMPDGNFPTAPYPNPEDSKVFKLALDMAKSSNPDIIFGTDPDCDRIGVVVKDSQGEYKVLTGNQTGLLLSNYILSALKEEKKLPENGVVIKTIVTSEGVKEIAKAYDIEVMDVLTGFKYIGEKMIGFDKNKDHNEIQNLKNKKQTILFLNRRKQKCRGN